MDHRISDRAQNVPGSPIRKLAAVADAAKAAGRTIYHLNIGQPDIATPPSALEAVKNDTSSIIAYGPAQGAQSLREIYANYYQKFGAQFTAADIFVTTGASEAILFALNATCNSGDEIIIPEPFYANYLGFAAFCAVEVVPLSSSFETQFSLPSAEAFRSKITSKTKAIFLCNPSNPTGKVYDKKALAEIVALVKEHDLFFIVDEVYKEFCYSINFESVTQFNELEDHVIVLDSISKIFSSCGARIGFLSTRNKKLQRTIAKACQMRLCPPYFGQLIAEAAYKDLKNYLPEVQQEYDRRRKKVYELVSKIDGVKSYLPDGAFYLIVELPVEDTDHFCKWLLNSFDYQNESLMLSPASGFYTNEYSGKRQVRIAFVLNEEDFSKAIKCLEMGLEKYQELHKESQAIALSK